MVGGVFCIVSDTTRSGARPTAGSGRSAGSVPLLAGSPDQADTRCVRPPGSSARTGDDLPFAALYLRSVHGAARCVDTPSGENDAPSGESDTLSREN